MMGRFTRRQCDKVPAKIKRRMDRPQRLASNLCGESPPRPKRPMDLCRMDLCDWISPAGAIKEVARKGETKNPQHFNLLITSEWHLVYSRVLAVNLSYGSCYHLCSISCGETCVLRFTNIHLANLCCGAIPSEVSVLISVFCLK
jgi:hypothetical protein